MERPWKSPMRGQRWNSMSQQAGMNEEQRRRLLDKETQHACLECGLAPWTGPSVDWAVRISAPTHCRSSLEHSLPHIPGLPDPSLLAALLMKTLWATDVIFQSQGSGSQVLFSVSEWAILYFGSCLNSSFTVSLFPAAAATQNEADWLYTDDHWHVYIHRRDL